MVRLRVSRMLVAMMQLKTVSVGNGGVPYPVRQVFQEPMASVYQEPDAVVISALVKQIVVRLLDV